jgi:hypothetical protein
LVVKYASLVNRAALAAALALVVTSAPLAQQGGQAAPANVAHLENVEGSVLVGSASGLVSGSKGLVLKEGTRVLTTAKGRVLVQFDDGCKVQMEPNQRYVVSRDKACEMRILMVQGSVPAVVPPTSTMGAAALSGNLEAAAAIGAVGVGVALWNRRDESVSPN